MPGKLYLLPNVLEESLPADPFFPISVADAVRSIQGLIVESEKAGRRYLRRFLSHDDMAQMPLAVLNEHQKEIRELLLPLKKGETWGLISDAGLPCIADPGAELVWLAHQEQVQVTAFPGPSSIVMALQLSGFSAQQFSFHGYLPREPMELERRIVELEKRGGTHLWIEAPYRSGKMVDLLKRILLPDTRVCIAANLTAPNERLLSQSIDRWRQSSFSLGKEPAVFVMSRSSH